MSRCVFLILVGLVACAGGEQDPPGGAALGSASSGASGTEVSSSGGAAGETTASGSSETASSTSGPTPATSDTTGAGDGSTGGTPESSSSTGGAATSWHRYSLDTAAGTWSQVPLSEIWVGENAPPPTGIAATTSLTHFDRLFVISDDRVVYEQADGVWQVPQPLDQRFPEAAGLDIDAMTHTPGQAASDVEDVFLIDTPAAVVYLQFENGGLELSGTSMLVDEEGGAPQGTVDNIWVIGRADPSGIGSDDDWLVWHQAFANGELWRFNAAFDWGSAPLDDNVYFTGAPGEPDAFTVEAAYYDDAFERAHFIAP